MKKLLLLLVASLTMLFVGCSQFDDSRIWDAIDELEEEQEKMQEQIDAQQTLLNALANNLSIISITPTAEGFLLTFSDGSTITVKHGEKGDKGDTGEKGEQGEKGDKGDTGEKGEQGEKGDKGDTGEKGEDGADGKDGQDGKDGADGDSLFQSVTWDEEYAYFTLSDGTVIKIPLASDSEAEEGDLPPANEIWYTSTDGNIVTPNEISAFGVNIVSNTYENGKGVIKFDGKIVEIGEEAFYYCLTLGGITIPESVTSIGDYVFYKCSALTNFIIPDYVTSIGEGAFAFCFCLRSMTIPNGVTSIGNYAFANCLSLEEVICQPTIVPDCGEMAFSASFNDELTPIGCSIYVPTESVEAYKSAYGWRDYADYIEGYDFENGGSDITQMVEVEAVYMIGLWSEDEGDYVTGFFICDKPWQDEGPANDSRTYGLSVWSKTAPVDDEIPHGTYNLGDTLGAFNGVEYIYTSNNGSEQCMYTDGIVVVGEGKIEATLTLENGEVHHVVYEGSLTTLGEGEIGG